MKKEKIQAILKILDKSFPKYRDMNSYSNCLKTATLWFEKIEEAVEALPLIQAIQELEPNLKYLNNGNTIIINFEETDLGDWQDWDDLNGAGDWEPLSE